MEEIQQNITITVAKHMMFRTVAHGKDVPQGLDINYYVSIQVAAHLPISFPSTSPPS